MKNYSGTEFPKDVTYSKNPTISMRIINALPFDVPVIPKTTTKVNKLQNAIDAFDKLNSDEVEYNILSLLMKKKLDYVKLTDRYRVYLETLNNQHYEKETEILGIAANLLVSNKNKDTCDKAMNLIKESKQFQDHVFEEVIDKRFKNLKQDKL